MKVILLQDIKRFGAKGSVQEVADGYANSYLIPRGLARVASAGDAQHAQANTEHKQAKFQKKQEDLENQFKKFNKKKITITANVGPSGKLFQAVTASDISSHLPGLNPSHLQLKHGIKELGEYQVTYKIGNLKGYVVVVVSR